MSAGQWVVVFFFYINHISLIIFHFTNTDMNCALMLSAQGAKTICLHMNELDPSGQVLFHSSEILWNLLERCSKDEVTAQLSSIECVVYVSHVVFKMFSNVADEGNVAT